MKIFVFGDSYSVEFDSPNLYPPGHLYCEWKGYVPKKYYHLLSDKFGAAEIKNYAKSGNDNENIFEKFTEQYEEIQEDDIVIFGWTVSNRFSICNYDNPKDSLWSSSVSYNHLEWVVKAGINKSTFLYHNRYMKLLNFINKVLKNNKVVHWFWDYKPDEEFTDDKTIKYETKGVINDYHYNEKAHMDLFKRIIENFETSDKVMIDLWPENTIHTNNIAITN